MLAGNLSGVAIESLRVIGGGMNPQSVNRKC